MRRGRVLVSSLLALGLLAAACGLTAVGSGPSPADGDAGGDAPSTSSDAPSEVDGSSGADGSSMLDAASDGSTTCTADLTQDSLNCGACGHDCLGGACAASTCQPVIFASGETGVTGVAIVGPNLVWTRPNDGLVRRMPLAGGAASSLVTAATGGPNNPYGIASEGAGLYLTDRAAGKVYRRALDGGAVWVVGSIVTPTGIAARGPSVFVTIQNQDAVDSIDLTGNNQMGRMSGLNYPAGVAVAGNRIYASSGSGILVGPLDGGQPVTNVSPTSRFKDGGGDLIHSGLAVDNGTVWFSIDALGVVASVPTAGGTAKVLADNQASPVGVAVSSDAIYWANSGDGTIMKLAR